MRKINSTDPNAMQIPDEMQDFVLVLLEGARKYKANGWLDKDGQSIDNKSNHASMFRHLAESCTGREKDKDTELHPLLHLACRALMGYVRYKRGIIHTLDEGK